MVFSLGKSVVIRGNHAFMKTENVKRMIRITSGRSGASASQGFRKEKYEDKNMLFSRGGFSLD